ncbi:MAG: hypothetical protein ACRC6M_16380 [Microcystaceae cyanobacterium]
MEYLYVENAVKMRSQLQYQLQKQLPYQAQDSGGLKNYGEMTPAKERL